MADGHETAISRDELRQIMDLLDRSHFDTLELKVGDFEFIASKSGRPGGSASELQSSPSRSAARPRGAAPAATAEPQSTPSHEAVGEPAQAEDAVTIPAPIVGIFYLAPEPGAAPFVEPGDNVDEDTAVGLIEVMKAFNTVTAGVRGTVLRRLVEDGGMVEYGQPLFLVKPE